MPNSSTILNQTLSNALTFSSKKCTIFKTAQKDSRNVSQHHKISCTFRPLPKKPKHDAYRTRMQIERSYIKKYVEVIGKHLPVGEPVSKLTYTNVFTFLLGFLKYKVIPSPFRFLFWIFWRYLCAKVLYPVQKKYALIDCRIDAALSRIVRKPNKFSLGMELMRLHGKVGPIGELRYRLSIVMRRNKSIDCWKEIFRNSIQPSPFIDIPPDPRVEPLY